MRKRSSKKRISIPTRFGNLEFCGNIHQMETLKKSNELQQ